METRGRRRSLGAICLASMAAVAATTYFYIHFNLTVCAVGLDAGQGGTWPAPASPQGRLCTWGGDRWTFGGLMILGVAGGVGVLMAWSLARQRSAVRWVSAIVIPVFAAWVASVAISLPRDSCTTTYISEEDPGAECYTHEDGY